MRPRIGRDRSSSAWALERTPRSRCIVARRSPSQRRRWDRTTCHWARYRCPRTSSDSCRRTSAPRTSSPTRRARETRAAPH
jgi:hypothetical protein